MNKAQKSICSHKYCAGISFCVLGNFARICGRRRWSCLCFADQSYPVYPHTTAILSSIGSPCLWDGEKMSLCECSERITVFSRSCIKLFTRAPHLGQYRFPLLRVLNCKRLNYTFRKGHISILQIKKRTMNFLRFCSLVAVPNIFVQIRYAEAQHHGAKAAV